MGLASRQIWPELGERRLWWWLSLGQCQVKYSLCSVCLIIKITRCPLNIHTLFYHWSVTAQTFCLQNGPLTFTIISAAQQWCRCSQSNSLVQRNEIPKPVFHRAILASIFFSIQVLSLCQLIQALCCRVKWLLQSQIFATNMCTWPKCCTRLTFWVLWVPKG